MKSLLRSGSVTKHFDVQIDDKNNTIYRIDTVKFFEKETGKIVLSIWGTQIMDLFAPFAEDRWETDEVQLNNLDKIVCKRKEDFSLDSFVMMKKQVRKSKFANSSPKEVILYINKDVINFEYINKSFKVKSTDGCYNNIHSTISISGFHSLFKKKIYQHLTDKILDSKETSETTYTFLERTEETNVKEYKTEIAEILCILGDSIQYTSTDQVEKNIKKVEEALKKSKELLELSSTNKTDIIKEDKVTLNL